MTMGENQKNLTKDTIELLQECHKGVHMGLAAITQVTDKITDPKFLDLLLENKKIHEELQSDVEKIIYEAKAPIDSPNPIAEGMSWISTNIKIAMDTEDATIADLLTDGCDMGIKSLRKYLNQYENADASVKDLCRKIIKAEEDLRNKLKSFL